MEPGNDKYRLLIENLPDAFAYHQVVTNSEGKPVDYIFLDVNQAFEGMSGLHRDKILGKKVKEVCQENGTLNFDWIGTYGQVALTGESIRFEQYLETAGRWYDITAYSDEPGYFITVFRDITESKKTEQTLRASEAKYRNLVENINEVAYILDENANITYVSPSVEYVSGYTPSELIKMRFTDFVHPDDLEGRIEQFLKVMSGVNEASEYRFITKDGRTVWVRTAARPVVKEGRVVGVQGVLTDITERKQAEEELKLKGEYLRGILESQNDLIVRVDLEYRFTYVNDAYCKTFGKTREELIGNSFTPLVHEEDIEHTLKTMEKLFVPPYRAYFEQRAMTIDGWRWIAWDDSGILNDKGEVVEIQAVGRDITEQKSAENKLRESENLMSAIIDNAKDSIFVKDTSLRYVKINKAMTFLFELPQEKILGMSDSDLFGPEFAEHVENIDRQVLEGETVEEFPAKPAGGEMKYFHTIKVPLKDDYGNIAGMCGIARDITERKQAEEALRYHYEFEKMISEIASYFIHLPADQVDEGINYALKKCGEFFQVERSYIILLSHDGQSQSITHEWHKKEVEPLINRLQDIPISKRPWWYGQITEKGYVHLPDVNEMPEEAGIEKKVVLEQNIKSLLSIPMITGSNIVGHLGLDAITDKKVWSEEHITLLKVLAELISNALERQWSDEKIRSLSFRDQLTGLYNRHMLKEEMQRLDTERQLPISIIMADLNGLKLVNDTYGHEVGDEILISAADILRNACRKEDIIARWGGDEFIILLPQTGENEAKQIENRIKEMCRDAYVNDMPISIAIGVSIKKDMKKDLLLVLKEAEDNMYKQKLVESQSTKSAVLTALLNALEEKSFETQEHTRNMQRIASKIAREIKLPDSEINRLKLLISLHDIGKINIDENILTKTKPLTPKEWELMKKHPETGYRIALATEEFAHLAKDILAHHEHWDGSGYPQGLKGENIPLLARITAIADAFEVMSRGRPYKKALPLEEIKSEFKRCAGTQFDPELVEAFLSILETGNNFGTQ